MSHPGINGSISECHGNFSAYGARRGRLWFGTRTSKSRLNFLELLRAGHTDYVLNDAAYGYMRKHSLSATLIAELMAETETRFADQTAWLVHLDRLGFIKLDVTPNPVQIAIEAALWGSVQSHKFLCDAVVLSDDAGQFNVGHHALWWVHAERLVHKLDTFNDTHRAAQTRTRGGRLHAGARPACLRLRHDRQAVHAAHAGFGRRKA
jgi:hypothetical protein